MTKKCLQKYIVAMFVLVIVVVYTGCCVDKQEYYRQRENYMEATGIISSITYGTEIDALYIDFAETSPIFDVSFFRIVGHNLSVVKANGIDEKLEVGDQIEFVTAPQYFGDGYVLPIVAISKNGEQLLSFDEGFTNFVKDKGWSNRRWKTD